MQAVELRLGVDKSETLAIEQWPCMVRPWTQAVQPGCRDFGRAARSSGGCNGDASEGMGKPARRWKREFSSGPGSSSDETRAFEQWTKC